MSRLLSILIGYCFGLFQTSYFYGKLHGVDIRTMGSGNAGTTNALRSLGAKAGLITLAGDVCKCILAVLVMYLLIGRNHPEILPLLKVYTAFGVIIGHDFPFYMHFRGGKGIAATGGMILSFGDWRLILLSIGLFVVLFFTTHYVSLASLSLTASFFIGMLVLTLRGGYDMMNQGQRIEMMALLAVITVMAFVQHRGNIDRLLHGCERKTYLKKKEA